MVFPNLSLSDIKINSATEGQPNKDEQIRKWFKNLNAYVSKVRTLLDYMRFLHERLSLLQILLQAGFVPDRNTRGNQIRDSARQLYDGKYKSHFDNLFLSIGDWFKAMSEYWVRVDKDLLPDSEGSLKFKADLLNDIRSDIIPMLLDKVCVSGSLHTVSERSLTSLTSSQVGYIPTLVSNIQTMHSISSSRTSHCPDAICSSTSLPREALAVFSVQGRAPP